MDNESSEENKGIKLGPPVIEVTNKVGIVPVRLQLQMPCKVIIQFEHLGRKEFEVSAPGIWEFNERIDPMPRAERIG